MSSSTLTFLFTDIEGSTQLWEKHPEAMKLALARHDVILRQAIESHGGQVFKTVGDAFCAAFPSAPNAVSAALDAQRALGAESWDETTVIKVRMGLHSGAAEQRDNDYFGATLNRVARLMSVGHGGQTLLSAITRELVQASLPEGVELRDMGERGLKDLIRPERIYQLTAPGLQTDFPPLKTLEAFRSNLPVQLTSFIGREKDISAVKSLMAEHCLVTLTGSGGTGKTRLSLQVAADLLDSFPDGVWFVELAPLSDPALVPQTVLATLGLREDSTRPLIETLTHYLQARKALLILDNCEHLVEAAAQLSGSLLRACLTLHILVSSREALGIPGEQPFHVHSLSTPKADEIFSVENLSDYESARLFMDRAKTVAPGFALTDANAPAVAKICARLDGIPLAIELAAARVKMLKVEQIAERLDDRFHLLTGGSRTALPRQQTLRALIDWSYDLLPESERALLRRLSVFAGGWTLEIAEKVCASEKSEAGNPKNGEKSKDEYLHPSDVLDSLTQLVNKSLVVVDADDGHASVETRYRLLETIRQYAHEKLSGSGEEDVVRIRHMNYFLKFANDSAPMLRSSQRIFWLQRLENEQDNLRAAIGLALKTNRMEGLQAAGALYWSWYSLGFMSEGREWIEQALALSDHILQDQPAQLTKLLMQARATALHGGGMLAFGQGDNIRANTLIEASIVLWQQLDDIPGLAEALTHLGNLRMYQGDHAAALRLHHESVQLLRQSNAKWNLAYALFLMGDALVIQDQGAALKLYEESLALFRSTGDQWGITLPLISLGHLAAEKGDFATARTLLEEGLALRRTMGDRFMLAISLNALAEVVIHQGELTTGARLLDESLKLNQMLGQKSGISWSLRNLGYLARAQDDDKSAEMFFRDALKLSYELGEKREISNMLEALAQATTAQESAARAVRLLSAADHVRQIIGVEVVNPTKRVNYDNQVIALRAELGEQNFSEIWTMGWAMSMDQAVAYALEVHSD